MALPSSDSIEMQSLLSLAPDGSDSKHIEDCRDDGVQAEEEELAECRICSEDDVLANLESPCKCDGTVKWAHHKCIQTWINEKGDKQCEICNSEFKGEYTVPEPVRLGDLSMEALAAFPFLGPFRQRIFVRAGPQGDGFSDVPETMEYGHGAVSAGSSQRVSGAYCMTLLLLVLGTVLLHRSSIAIMDNSPHAENNLYAGPANGSNSEHHYPHPRPDMQDPWHSARQPSSKDVHLDLQVVMMWSLIRLVMVFLPLLIMMRVLVVMRDARRTSEMHQDSISAHATHVDVARLLQEMERGVFSEYTFPRTSVVGSQRA